MTTHCLMSNIRLNAWRALKVVSPTAHAENRSHLQVTCWPGYRSTRMTWFTCLRKNNDVVFVAQYDVSFYTTSSYIHQCRFSLAIIPNSYETRKRYGEGESKENFGRSILFTVAVRADAMERPGCENVSVSR